LAYTPSQVVGHEVRALRKKREWSQQRLAERLKELGTVGWGQSKIAKLETGKVRRISIEDVYELATALDVAPIYLLAPRNVHDTSGKPPLKVRVAPRITRFPQQVRPWVEGELPLLNAGDYRTDEDALDGRKFFWFDSRPIDEWDLEQASAMRQASSKKPATD
jgi:transcriptional regulator with XRE-family HTH domain